MIKPTRLDYCQYLLSTPTDPFSFRYFVCLNGKVATGRSLLQRTDSDQKAQQPEN